MTLLENIDILKHRLVPKQEIISERAKEELLSKYGIVIRQLPRIFSTDPVVTTIGAKIGDVVKITREDAFTGKSVYYRVVIKV